MTAVVRSSNGEKSLTEFAGRKRQKIRIIFPNDMRVGENTAQAASVEFLRQRRKNYARSRLQIPCRKKLCFFDNHKKDDRSCAVI